MKHEKTFDAIGKLKDIELELHRLKNALEMANKGLDAQRQWVGLEAEDLAQIESDEFWQVGNHMAIAMAVEAKLKEKNHD